MSSGYAEFMTNARLPEFRSNLDRWLWRNRMSAAELARKCDMDRSTVSRLARGEYTTAESLAIEKVKQVTGLKAL
jgi:predicted XRE-type DNA-binding protein